MRTSFNHQPEAQHHNSPAIYTPAGRLPHLCQSRQFALQHIHDGPFGQSLMGPMPKHHSLCRWSGQFLKRLARKRVTRTFASEQASASGYI
jgi:hypothetical protein